MTYHLYHYLGRSECSYAVRVACVCIYTTCEDGFSNLEIDLLLHQISTFPVACLSSYQHNDPFRKDTISDI